MNIPVTIPARAPSARAAVPEAPSRSLLVASCEPLTHPLFVPLARLLRERGWTVDFLTPHLRSRLFLRRGGEAPLGLPRPARLPELPPGIESAVAFRCAWGGLRDTPALRDYARWLLGAALETVPRYGAVLLWNGNDLWDAAAAHAARESRTQRLYAENGLFPGTVQLDPEGVNAAAAAARRVARESAAHQAKDGIAPTPGRASGAPLWLRAGATLLEWAEAWARPERARFSIRHRVRTWVARRRHRRPLPGDSVALPPGCVFVPLQVHDDTQILLHGGWVRSMEGLVAAVRDAAGGAPVVVREHPVDVGRIDHRALRARFPDVLWTRTRELAPCIRNAGAVVTVNSTVGVEALLLGRPVVVCGEAAYGVAGAVELARTERELEGAIARARAAGEAPAFARQVLSCLRDLQHVAVDRHAPDAAGLRRLADRIEALASARRA